MSVDDETMDTVFKYDTTYSRTLIGACWSPKDYTTPLVLVAVWSRRWFAQLLYTHVFHVQFVRAEDGSPAVTLHPDLDLRVDWLDSKPVVGEWAGGIADARRAAFYGMWSRGWLDQPAISGSGMLPEVLRPTLDGWRFLTGAACPAVAVDEPNAV